jgi:hypothetical protein
MTWTESRKIDAAITIPQLRNYRFGMKSRKYCKNILFNCIKKHNEKEKNQHLDFNKK